MVGWLAGFVMGSSLKTVRIEEVLVAVFGAFIGGEFVSPMLGSGAATGRFSGVGLGTAVAGAVVLMVLLKVMRGAVGPMRNAKGPARRRD